MAVVSLSKPTIPRNHCAHNSNPSLSWKGSQHRPVHDKTLLSQTNFLLPKNIQKNVCAIVYPSMTKPCSAKLIFSCQKISKKRVCNCVILTCFSNSAQLFYVPPPPPPPGALPNPTRCACLLVSRAVPQVGTIPRKARQRL